MVSAGNNFLACKRGFTLLEVMIALAIVSIALVGLLGLGNRSIGVHDRLQKITQGTLLAQQRMTEIENQAERGRLQLVVEEGFFEDPFQGYQWRITFQETPISFVQMVTVTVIWGTEARNESVDLTSFVFQ